MSTPARHTASSLRGIAIAVPAIVLSACAQESDQAISRDSQPFDAVAEDATIDLIGTEPFWRITIANGEANYSDPQNIDGTAFPVDRFAGNNGLGFSGDMAGEPVQVTLTPGQCSDGMSDRTYPYTATVKLGDELLKGCGWTSKEPYSEPEAV
jgi:uncharacterized membrane protein